MKERENTQCEREQDEMKHEQAEQIELMKDDQKDRHDREVESIQNRFQAKLDLERQRLASSNN